MSKWIGWVSLVYLCSVTVKGYRSKKIKNINAAIRTIPGLVILESDVYDY